MIVFNFKFHQWWNKPAMELDLWEYGGWNTNWNENGTRRTDQVILSVHSSSDNCAYMHFFYCMLHFIAIKDYY